MFLIVPRRVFMEKCGKLSFIIKYPPYQRDILSLSFSLLEFCGKVFPYQLQATVPIRTCIWMDDTEVLCVRDEAATKARYCITFFVFSVFPAPDSPLSNKQQVQIYRKNPKNSDTPKICCNYPKIWTMCLYHWVTLQKDADGMANSVDPDQSDLGLHCLQEQSDLGLHCLQKQSNRGLHCLPRPICPKT